MSDVRIDETAALKERLQKLKEKKEELQERNVKQATKHESDLKEALQNKNSKVGAAREDKTEKVKLKHQEVLSKRAAVAKSQEEAAQQETLLAQETKAAEQRIADGQVNIDQLKKEIHSRTISDVVSAKKEADEAVQKAQDKATAKQHQLNEKKGKIASEAPLVKKQTQKADRYKDETVKAEQELARRQKQLKESDQPRIPSAHSAFNARAATTSFQQHHLFSTAGGAGARSTTPVKNSKGW